MYKSKTESLAAPAAENLTAKVSPSVGEAIALLLACTAVKADPSIVHASLLVAVYWTNYNPAELYSTIKEGGTQAVVADSDIVIAEANSPVTGDPGVVPV